MEKALDVPPPQLALRLHERVQYARGNVGALDGENIEAEVQRGIRALKFLTRDFGTLDGARVLELGTGWHGTDAVLLALLGARVTTIDQLPHLNWKLVRRVVNACQTSEEIGDQLADLGEADRNVVLARCRLLDEWAAGRGVTFGSSAPIYYHANPEYLSYIENESAYDVFYTYSVLQRLPAVALENVLDTVSAKLAPTGWHAHVVHHTDHMARHGVVGPLTYLRLPEALFHAIQSRRFNYQNRFRSREFLDLIRAYGSEVVSVDTASSDGPLPARVAKRFRSLSAGELRISRTQVTARCRGAASATPTP